MSEEETKAVVIKDFFKSSVILNELDEVLKFKPDTLIGIDQISSEKLLENNVKNIEELAHLSLESLPIIKEIPNNVLIKWVKIAQVLEKAIKAVQAIFSSKIPELMKISNDMYSANQDVTEILYEVSEVIRNIQLIKAQEGKVDLVDLPEEEVKELSTMGDSLTLTNLVKLSGVFSDVATKINLHINGRMVLESTLINCAYSLKK